MTAPLDDPTALTTGSVDPTPWTTSFRNPIPLDSFFTTDATYQSNDVQ